VNTLMPDPNHSPEPKRQDKTTLKQGAGHWPQCP